jgi:multisubunit Na+/H+ antiporter MnhB subunit
MTRNLLSGLIVAMIVVALGLVATDLPPFGAVTVPAQNEIYDRYVNNVREDTGALNSVAAVVFDYRGYDTLGEATVLFAAATAVAAVLFGTVHRDEHHGQAAAAGDVDAGPAQDETTGEGARHG